MKRFAKCICLMLILALCLPSTALAEQQESASTYSYYFSSYGTGLGKITDRKFEISFNVIARDDMDELGAYSIELQRSTSGTGDWVTVKTYTPSNYPELMDTNATFHTGCVYYTGGYGCYYRAYVTFCASKGNGAGYVSAYSNVLKI